MIRFDPLWKTTASKDMNKGDLQKTTRLSPVTIAKLVKNESITLEVIDRICECLNVPKKKSCTCLRK